MFPRAKKSFGQNFLADPSVIGKIVAAAELKPGEWVLEIGPGTGVLTEALLAAGANVVAVEADADLIPALRERFPALDLITGDIIGLRRTDPKLGGRLEEGAYKLVANIPYNLTSAILEDFLSRSPRPSRLVLMLQKEVADRLVAEPPDMSLLSVVCQLYADVRRVASVPRGAFRPSPKVDSAVVLLNLQPFDSLRSLRAGSTTDNLQPEPIIRLAKAGFSAPRKQLHGNLAAAGHGTSTRLKTVLESLGLRSDIRAEALTVGDWTRLYQVLNAR